MITALISNAQTEGNAGILGVRQYATAQRAGKEKLVQKILMIALANTTGANTSTRANIHASVSISLGTSINWF